MSETRTKFRLCRHWLWHKPGSTIAVVPRLRTWLKDNGYGSDAKDPVPEEPARKVRQKRRRKTAALKG